MNEHTFRVLEYDKTREIVAAYAASAPGKAALAGLLPATDIDAVVTRLEETRELTALMKGGERPPLNDIKDVRAPVERLAAAGILLAPAQLFDIAVTLGAARRVKSFFQRVEGQGRGQRAPLLCAKAAGLRPLKHLEDEVFGAIDDKAEVKDSASPELRKIRKQIGRTRDEIMHRLSRIMQDSGSAKVVQEPVITVRDDRYVLPLKPNFRQGLQGVVHGQSSSRATLFVEPLEVLEQNNRLAELRIEERDEVDRILRRLTALLADERDAIEVNLVVLAEIDVVYAKARFGLEYGGSVPEVSVENRIRLKRARHPLLLWKSRSPGAGASSVVPNEIELGGESRVMIISGPNAGGKTVVLKTIGLLCLMAQAGLPVTAGEGSELPVFGSVFADIGDEQSLEHDLSTFSSHVSRLAEILQHARHDTLVLLDELGAGTDPAEGAALGAAVLEALLERGCMTITTTHHTVLKLFGAQTAGVMNGAMEFDPATLEPTYRFIPGRPGRSYGLSMAARLGVPREVVEDARARLGRDEARLEKLLEQVERESREIESQKLALEHDLDAARRMRAEADASLRAAREESGAVKIKARDEAREVLAALRQRLKELSRAPALDQAEAKRAASEVEALGRRLKPDESEQHVLPASRPDLRAGERVRIPRFSTTGTVLTAQAGMLEVEVNGKKLKLRADEVVPMEQVLPDQAAGAAPGWSAVLSNDADIPDRLNVVGLHVAEAITEVDRYLNRLAVSGRSFATIIHGLGTGALKTAIVDFLKTHPLVSRVRPGESAEGGAGATVAELKK